MLNKYPSHEMMLEFVVSQFVHLKDSGPKWIWVEAP